MTSMIAFAKSASADRAMPDHSPSPILNPRRILVRGVNWLGDAVMTTPALLRLREHFPQAHIALATPEKLADLWRAAPGPGENKLHPAINEIISLAAGKTVFSVGDKFRAGSFDLALVLPNSPRSAMETWLGRIPQRVGYARPWRNFFLTTRVASRSGATKMRKRSAREIKQLVAADVNRRTDRVFTSAATNHQIHDYLHLVAALGAKSEPLPPRLVIAPDEIKTAAEKFGLAAELAADRPIFGLNPGAEYGPAKRWPIERFIAAAREIQQHTRCLWLIFGGKGDAEITGRVESETRNSLAAPKRSEGGKLEIRNFTGKTSLRDLMSLLKLCRVLLTNDTGPMHLAAALGTPVVVPFGSTSPELTGPISAGAVRHQLIRSDAPCSPCFLRECPIDFRCMNGISVERVVSGVLEVLKPK